MMLMLLTAVMLWPGARRAFGYVRPQTLHVHLFASHSLQEKILFVGPLQIHWRGVVTLPSGRYQAEVRKNEVVIHGIDPRNLKIASIVGRELIIKGTTDSGLAVCYGNCFRRYPGDISISVSTSGSEPILSKSLSPAQKSKAPHLVLINNVISSAYVAGVCAAEMPIETPLEALKAQAVLVNTEIARYPPGIDIDDTTQRQCYQGIPAGRSDVREAVRSVGAQCLLFHGVPIKPYFHSTCAGMTSNAADIFQLKQRSYPYLAAVKCEYCKSSPFWHTTVSQIPRSEFASVFGSTIPKIESTDKAGRPLVISYAVHGQTIKESGYKFWLKLGQSFGWDKAPGNLFTLSARQSTVLIQSRGAGHGVGMCQWGAIGMAREGKDYKQILAHYFPGTTLSD